MTSKVRLIEPNVQYGLYIWRLPDGHLLRNEDNDFLSIQAYKGDMRAIAELKQAAAYYGFPDGDAWFYVGGRQVSDSEYSEQLDRLKEGYIPSLNDLGAVADAQEGVKLYGSDY